jgi:phytoene synthase
MSSDAFDHCQALVREADKDRFLATLFAPEKHRRPLLALYAFNAEIARVRDAVRDPMAGEIRLQWWREVFTGSGRGEVRANPVAAALLDTVVRYGLPPQMLVEVIEARSFDLHDDPIATVDELEGYAEKTSSSLIALAARVLGDGRAPDVSAAARAAGVAYAISGLLRALPLHASRGQFYLPLDLVERHGAQPADVLAGKPTTEVRAALAELRLHGRGHLTQARARLAELPPAVLPAFLPVALVRPALDRMERSDYKPFRPNEIPQWRKQLRLWWASRDLPRRL